MSADIDMVPTQNDDVGESETPIIEMCFSTSEEARDYYEDYGRKKGFCIRTRTSYKKHQESEATSVLFVCNREGIYVSNSKNEEKNSKELDGESKIRRRSCSTFRCDCKAQMRLNYEKWSGKWKVTLFDDTHNHALVTPSKSMKMKSNKQMPKAVKNLAEAFRRENLEVSKVTSIFGGEHMGFDDRGLWNYLSGVTHKNLDGGDAQWVSNYFKNKQAQNPQFFYAIQCDEESRATNFFWVDSRSRMAYRYFGDVVSFDTTYRTNKYGMPFAPFTGVNHHFQSIQFGCALLQDETEVTFLWLFRTWLGAMGGRPPISFLTDQDLAMKGAIAKVFPNTHHRLCIWHILKKFVEKFGQVYYKRSKFKKDVKRCIWSTYKKEDFDENWMSVMKEYGLENDHWLQNMFDIRESWIPAYNRGTFFAGLNTTGRSEGVNSFFNDFVTSSTNLREFVIKYEHALKKIVRKENDEDFESEHKKRIVGKYEYLLTHAAEVYTRNIFKKFKDEMIEINNYRVEEKGNIDGLQSFLVLSKVNESQKFTIILDLQTLKGTCECQYFEFVGIPCRHILKILDQRDIDKLPDHFILPRWRQKANKFRINYSSDLVHDDGNEESEILRLSHLCQESTKVSCVAAQSYEGYKILMEGLNDISEKLTKLSIDVPPPSDEELDLHSNENPSQQLLLDPNISQTKGRRKENERIKSGIELSSKKKRKCHLCGVLGHDKRTCPDNPMSKRASVIECENGFDI